MRLINKDARQTTERAAVGEILAALLMHKGWNQTILSKKSGVSQPAINRILKMVGNNNGVVRRPHETTLIKISNALEVSVGQLIGAEPLSPKEVKGFAGTILRVPDVPVVELNRIGRMGFIGDRERLEGRQWLLCPVLHSGNTFAFPVRSEEMLEAINGYAAGDIVFVDPCIIGGNGDDVVVRTRIGEIIFRRLFINGDGVFLTVINPSFHHLFTSFEGHELIGTAVVSCRIRGGGFLHADLAV